MTTAWDQAADNEDGHAYMSALDAFAQANGFLDHEDGERDVLAWVTSLMAAFEAQGVLPMEEVAE